MNDATMSWVNAGSTLGDQLFMFGRGNSTHALQNLKTSKTVLNTTGCGTFQSADSDNLSPTARAWERRRRSRARRWRSVLERPSSQRSRFLLVMQPATAVRWSRTSSPSTPLQGFPASAPRDAPRVAHRYRRRDRAVGLVRRRATYRPRRRTAQAIDLPELDPCVVGRDGHRQWDNLTFIAPSAGVGATQGYMPQLGANAWATSWRSRRHPTEPSRARLSAGGRGASRHLDEAVVVIVPNRIPTDGVGAAGARLQADRRPSELCRSVLHGLQPGQLLGLVGRGPPLLHAYHRDRRKPDEHLRHHETAEVGPASRVHGSSRLLVHRAG